MLITKLEKQKRAKHRWNIFVDGEFFCGLHEDTMLKFGIHVNEEVSERKLNEIKDFDEYVYAKNAAYDSLSYRIRSVSEIRKKLKEKKISEPAITKVLQLLSEQNLVNDAEFAKVLIGDKIKKKPVGRKVLMQKLFEKGVSKEVSQNAMESYFTPNDEKALALESFKKYYKKIKDRDLYEQKRKTYEHLARNGFDYEVISEIINEELK